MLDLRSVSVFNVTCVFLIHASNPLWLSSESVIMHVYYIVTASLCCRYIRPMPSDKTRNISSPLLCSQRKDRCSGTRSHLKDDFSTRIITAMCRNLTTKSD